MSCLKCLKYTMCVVNFIFFICGAVLFGFGIYLSTKSHYLALFPSISINIASALYIMGIFITCVSFLGFLGALKENRCLLITFFSLLFLLMLAELAVACSLLLYEKDVNSFIESELMKSLNQNITESQKTLIHDWDTVQTTFHCCGVNNKDDWKGKIPNSCCSSPPCYNTTYTEGCYKMLSDWFDKNILGAGLVVISICSIEVLGMCFAMTLFCHITKSGLGYK